MKHDNRHLLAFIDFVSKSDDPENATIQFKAKMESKGLAFDENYKVVKRVVKYAPVQTEQKSAPSFTSNKAPKEVKSVETKTASQLMLSIGESAKLNCKGLAIGGAGGESLAIDKMLSGVIQRATTYSGMLNGLEIPEAGSAKTSTLISRTNGATGKRGESDGNSDFFNPFDDTPVFGEVVSRTAKNTSYFYATDEVVNDTGLGGSIDLVEASTALFSRELRNDFGYDLIFGDGTTGEFNGLFGGRYSKVESAKPSDTRSLDFISGIQTGVLGGYPTTDNTEIVRQLNELISLVAEEHRKESKFYMSSFLRKHLRDLTALSAVGLIDFKVVNIDGKPIELLFGYEIVIDDNIPDVDGSTASPLAFFGHMAGTVMLERVDERLFANPFKLDGIVTYEMTSRIKESMKDNTAMAILVAEGEFFYLKNY